MQPLATHLIPNGLGFLAMDAREALELLPVGEQLWPGQQFFVEEACGRFWHALYHRLLHTLGQHLPQMVGEQLCVVLG